LLILNTVTELQVDIYMPPPAMTSTLSQQNLTFVTQCTNDKSVEKLYQSIPETSEKHTQKVVFLAHLDMV